MSVNQVSMLHVWITPNINPFAAGCTNLISNLRLYCIAISPLPSIEMHSLCHDIRECLLSSFSFVLAPMQVARCKWYASGMQVVCNY